MPRKLLALALAALLPLACHKDESKSVTSDLDAAAAKPKRFDPDPLGTIPPMDTSDPPPEDTAAAAPSASGSAAPLASVAASGAANASATPVASTAVRLIDPGAEPREKLRYKFKVGRTETVRIDLATTATIEAQGQQQAQKIPPIRVALAIVPKAITPEGDLRYEYRVVGADIAADPGAPPQITAPLKAGLDGMRGLTGWAIVTPRGVTKDASFEAPSGASQSTMQIMEQIRQSAQELAAPLPEEAVGKGAKWERTMKIDARGAKTTQKETYTLVDRSGDTGALDLAATASAPAAASPGDPVRLDGMTSVGKGHRTFDLGRLVATASLDATLTMNLSAPDESGAAQKIKMITRVALKIAPAPASSAAPK